MPSRRQERLPSTSCRRAVLLLPCFRSSARPNVSYYHLVTPFQAALLFSSHTGTVVITHSFGERTVSKGELNRGFERLEILAIP
jgi:hypothetical protein